MGRRCKIETSNQKLQSLIEGRSYVRRDIEVSGRKEATLEAPER